MNLPYYPLLGKEWHSALSGFEFFIKGRDDKTTGTGNSSLTEASIRNEFAGMEGEPPLAQL